MRVIITLALGQNGRALPNLRTVLGVEGPIQVEEETPDRMWERYNAPWKDGKPDDRDRLFVGKGYEGPDERGIGLSLALLFDDLRVAGLACPEGGVALIDRSAITCHDGEVVDVRHHFVRAVYVTVDELDRKGEPAVFTEESRERQKRFQALLIEQSCWSIAHAHRNGEREQSLFVQNIRGIGGSEPSRLVHFWQGVLCSEGIGDERLRDQLIKRSSEARAVIDALYAEHLPQSPRGRHARRAIERAADRGTTADTGPRRLVRFGDDHGPRRPKVLRHSDLEEQARTFDLEEFLES